MKIAMPVYKERISPVLDVAKQFWLIDFKPNYPIQRRAVRIETMDLVAKSKRIAELGSQVLICGAVSWPLEAMLVSAGIRVIPNTCGSAEEVLQAFITGDFSDKEFLMPGCTGKRRRWWRQQPETSREE